MLKSKLLFNKNSIDDLCFQEHAQGLLEEIEELLMTNKLLSKEKEEQKAAIAEGNRENIAMKRNIEEVNKSFRRNV